MKMFIVTKYELYYNQYHNVNNRIKQSVSAYDLMEAKCIMLRKYLTEQHNRDEIFAITNKNRILVVIGSAKSKKLR